MAKLYYEKIKNKETNPETEMTWKLEDVPTLWREEVSAMLEEASDAE
jgi:hypothetical protein